MGYKLLLAALLPMMTATARAQQVIGLGWAKNSVNTTIFRKNSVVSLGREEYAAFYDGDGYLTLAKRLAGDTAWTTKRTPYVGQVRDAHNSISIMVDGNNYLHVSWAFHNNPLHYCRSVAPGSLEVTAELPMIGNEEAHVTYPEFFRLRNGDLLFLYRDGASGRGNLVMNRYSTKKMNWVRVQDNLVDGESRRSAYWQTCVDDRGVIHLSWVWRESPDVATNHDLCYARSSDGGKTWRRADGSRYKLPITAATAELAVPIAQNSELINQTSMCTDQHGHPYIATYWRRADSQVPQYFIVYHDGKHWQTQQVTKRTTPFTLGGAGTKKIPVSRPQVLADKMKVYMVFRDEERGSRPSVAVCENIQKGDWQIRDLSTENVGQWEPSYDTEWWRQYRQLHLFVQRTGQGDKETLEELAPQPVYVLEWSDL